MKFSESLKRNADFQNVYKNGKSYANRHLVLYVLDNQTGHNRLGISVSKKSGKQRGQTQSDPVDQRKLQTTRRHVQQWFGYGSHRKEECKG